MRSDHGTENTIIALCQMALRHHHTDHHAGSNSFVFGSSVRNTVGYVSKGIFLANKHTPFSALKAGGLDSELSKPHGGLIFSRYIAAYIILPIYIVHC